MIATELEVKVIECDCPFFFPFSKEQSIQVKKFTKLRYKYRMLCMSFFCVCVRLVCVLYFSSISHERHCDGTCFWYNAEEIPLIYLFSQLE